MKQHRQREKTTTRGLRQGRRLPVRIRQATAADIPELIALNRAVQATHANAFPGRFRRDAPVRVIAKAFGTMLASGSSCWLVAEAEKPLGFLSAEFRWREETWCQASHHACYLAGIVVAPAFRRRGIARALFEALQREATTRGVTIFEADVWAFNEAARALFVHLGFRRMLERFTLSTEPSGKARSRRGGRSIAATVGKRSS